MFYSALAWTVGPVTGVWLLDLWQPAPFVVSIAAALVLLAVFWIMRLGNGKIISKARTPAANPLSFIGRFFAQPRLIAGWLFAVIRSCGWWVYVVYLPIFAVEAGLGDKIGGTLLSMTNALLFTTPLMLRWMQRRTVRTAVRTGFFVCGTTFILADDGLFGAFHRLGHPVHRICFSHSARHCRGSTLSACSKTFRAHRNVCSLFKFPGRLGHCNARCCLAGSAGVSAIRGICRHWRGPVWSMGPGWQAASPDRYSCQRPCSSKIFDSKHARRVVELSAPGQP